MKFFLFCWSLLLLCPLVLKAQSNYKPGYAVTLSGDTLRGYINYREWEFTPAAVTFKEDITSGAEKVLDVSNTRYIEISGMEAYERFEGRITMNQVEAGRISYESKALLEPVVIFLKINYKGDLLDMLSYTDNIKTRFFFREKDGSQPQELYYNRYYASSNNTSQITIQKGYVGQLQYLANKYDVSSSVLDREIEYAQYTKNDLVNLFHMINRIRVSSSAPKDYDSNSTRYFAGISMNSSTVRFTGIRGLNEPNNNPISFMPRATFGTDVFLNRYIQKLYFRVEGALTAANYYTENELGNEQEKYRYSYKISQQSFSISPQLIYSLYNTDNLKFHIGIIGQVSLSAYSDNIFRRDYTYTYKHLSSPPLSTSEEYPGYMGLENFWFTYAFRAGVVLNKRYELYALYAPYAAIIHFYTSKIEVRSLHLGMNYLFNK